MDVVAADVARAIANGFDDPETIKRYTGALMGPCQGKRCSDLFMQAVAQHTGRPLEDLRRPTARPPALPVRLGQVASATARRTDGAETAQ
jgi:bacterioferritin-associated ferredoxin